VTSMSGVCSSCGSEPPSGKARFCANCGQALQPPGNVPAREQGIPGSRSSTNYSTGLVNAVRLLAAACMFSGMYAAWIYDVTAEPGRLLVISSIGVALVGVVFVSQASRKATSVWASALLMLFWIGIVALAISWVLIRSA